MTGTGYASADYGLWGAQSIAFFFIIMFIGGCAGSTSCGIKIFRFQVLYRRGSRTPRRVLYPHGVFVKRFNGRPLDPRVPLAVTTFVFLYLAAFAVLSIALQLTGLDLLTAVSGAGSAISNVGPGLGKIIGPSGTYQPLNDTAKWLLSFGMLLGRLELFTVLVLFLPRFWRS
jgi:trk system potassium uptake protein TrkH